MALSPVSILNVNENIFSQSTSKLLLFTSNYKFKSSIQNAHQDTCSEGTSPGLGLGLAKGLRLALVLTPVIRKPEILLPCDTHQHFHKCIHHLEKVLLITGGTCPRKLYVGQFLLGKICPNPYFSGKIYSSGRQKKTGRREKYCLKISDKMFYKVSFYKKEYHQHTYHLHYLFKKMKLF